MPRKVKIFVEITFLVGVCRFYLIVIDFDRCSSICVDCNMHIYKYFPPNPAELRIRIRPNSESESGRNPNPNPAELRNLVGDLRIARIDPSRGGGIKETRVDLF